MSKKDNIKQARRVLLRVAREYMNGKVELDDSIRDAAHLLLQKSEQGHRRLACRLNADEDRWLRGCYTSRHIPRYRIVEMVEKHLNELLAENGQNYSARLIIESKKRQKYLSVICRRQS
ncbi:hypothetical protein GWN26_01465 [Candidatus Saccharibacteria bacterium]|nr:hypothetical protein [Candidatus Saccharibacteria bacterium]NIV03237.1 hypothetical protein [Calditrichia bacterium]NIS37750.1 hypothetical protein [Candidatus Saccharibacteria bacterium]NIV71358.1 hypothetical protein [Calditrichia bacterium]NIV97874.1 hypothetical protein [Candidatus Saccharibacteria bacterium]